MNSRRLVATAVFGVLTWVAAVTPAGANESSMPYADAGLTDAQAAAHLLDRFSFGPRPGDVEAVVSMGLDEWFSRQLYPHGSSPDVDRKLDGLRSLRLSNEEIARSYPNPGRVRRQAIEEGRLDPEEDDKGAQRRALREYYEQHGYRPQRELLGELLAQKMILAIDSPHQVQEVMADFWFNHFYVSATDNQCRRFVGTYERDAIRPFVFKNFGEMLEASAQHPAMLLYLDNAQSTAGEDVVTTAALAQAEMRQRPGRQGDAYGVIFDRMEAERRRRRMESDVPEEFRPRRGLNENYARELLELHTLGVDGGYAQEDVVEVARAFTGWTVLPDGERRRRIEERMQRNAKMGRELGFVVQGDFMFNAQVHDAGEKWVLGRYFPIGGGVEEGTRILDMLVAQPATADHIARKLAVRFVSDEPPQSVVDRIADRFHSSRGAMRPVIWEIVRSPEFWESATRGAKIKSPFELCVSSVRALDANVEHPGKLVEWTAQMGQPLYRYQAPTGFPDRAEVWVNAGSLLQRMNFGMSLAEGRVRGVNVDLDGLLNGQEPESLEAALAAYARVLLPERDLESTLQVLRPLVRRPDVAEEIRSRAEQDPTARPFAESAAGQAPDDMEMMDAPSMDAPSMDTPSMDTPSMMGEPSMDAPPESANPVAELPANRKNVAQIVGVILGSPEFQRR